MCKIVAAILGNFWLQVSGTVDQSAGMLDEDVRAKGYALLCVSEPRSDCKIKVIEEVSSIFAHVDNLLHSPTDDMRFIH